MRHGITGLIFIGLMGLGTVVVAEPAHPLATGEAARASATAQAAASTQVAALPAESAATVDKPAAEQSPETPKQSAALNPAPAKPRPAAPTVHAVIDLSSQRMTVRVDGETRHTWKISSGRAGYHTPRGTFRPTWLSRMHYSRQYDGAPMPYSVFFNRGIATHGTGAVSRLGRPASHGCIRLQTANARTFYNLVRKHGKSRVRIVVTGTTPASSVPVARRQRPARSTQRVVRRETDRTQTRRRDIYDTNRTWWSDATRSNRQAARPSSERIRSRRTSRRAERRVYRRETTRQMRYVRRPAAQSRPFFARPRGRLVFPGDR